MAGSLVECPRCAHQNAASTERCSKCGIDLPWAIEHWEETVSGPQEPESPLILIVDDEPAELTLVGMMLNRGGYRVTKALDGSEALNKAPRLQPDLIITGVMMPGMDGFELIRCLKARPPTQNIPVFVLTARSDKESVREGFDAGAIRYMSKPMLHDDLIVAVRSFLQGWPLLLLVCDDIPREIFAAFTEKRWCAVRLRSTEQFIEEVRRAEPDAIAIAFHLAEANWLDMLMLAQLKAEPDLANIPVVMLAESAEPELERQAMELGAYGVYTGPLDAEKLLARLPPLPSHHNPRLS